jgi:hypothetical protein
MAHDGRLRQAATKDNDRQIRPTELNQTQSRITHTQELEYEEGFVPDDKVSDHPNVEAELARGPTSLLLLKNIGRLVQPRAHETKSSARTNDLVKSEPICKDAKNEVEAVGDASDADFDENWGQSEGVEEHVEADSEDNEEEE